MNKPVSIRPPFYDEMERFFDVYNTGLPFVDETTPEKFRKTWEKNANEGKLERLWRVALVDDVVVGIVINTINVPLRWGLVWELAVIPEMRGRGIGSRLVTESEHILTQQDQKIKGLALGVKTENLRAIALYERMGYGIRSVVLRMLGDAWKPRKVPDIVVQTPGPHHLAELKELSPDAYWSTCDARGWRTGIRDKNGYVFYSKNAEGIVGFARLLHDEDNQAVTEIPFHVRSGFGIPFIEAVVRMAKTRLVDIWVQDNHQDVIDHLFSRGFKRRESEFLMVKNLSRAVS